MITRFATLCRACGLSAADAAVALDIRLEDTLAWYGGPEPAPECAIDRLAEIHRMIDRHIDNFLDDLYDDFKADGIPSVLELSVSSDDGDARRGGWPCKAVQHTAAFHIAAVLATSRIAVEFLPYDSSSPPAAHPHHPALFFEAKTTKKRVRRVRR